MRFRVDFPFPFGLPLELFPPGLGALLFQSCLRVHLFPLRNPFVVPQCLHGLLWVPVPSCPWEAVAFLPCPFLPFSAPSARTLGLHCRCCRRLGSRALVISFGNQELQVGLWRHVHLIARSKRIDTKQCLLILTQDNLHHLRQRSNQQQSWSFSSCDRSNCLISATVVALLMLQSASLPGPPSSGLQRDWPFRSIPWLELLEDLVDQLDTCQFPCKNCLLLHRNGNWRQQHRHTLASSLFYLGSTAMFGCTLILSVVRGSNVNSGFLIDPIHVGS